MRYSEWGSLAAGVGQLSVDQRPLGPGYFIAWRDADTLLANAPGDDGIYRLYQYRRPMTTTGAWSKDELDARGATTGGGGKGDYAVTLQSQPRETYGRVNNAVLPEWTRRCTVLDGSPDGRYLMASEDYTQFLVLGPIGTLRVFPLTPHVNLSTVRLIDSGFVYQDESRPHTLMLQLDDFLPRPISLFETPFNPTSFVYNGQRWVFYHNNGTWLHVEGATRGYKFAASYGPDVFVQPGGLTHVALTSSPGEGAETIQRLPVFSLGEGMIDLTPAPVPVDIAIIGRPMWFGWFTFAGRSLTIPGNCDLPVQQGADNVIRDNNHRAIARYINAASDSDIDALDALIRTTRQHDPTTPIVPYWTRQAQTIREPDNPDVGVELYQGDGESDADFEARGRDAVRRCVRAWIIFQCYTSNDRNTKNLRSIPPVIARIARDLLNVVGLLGFSGTGRATGLQEHPEVVDDWKAVVRGIPSAPVIVDPSPTPLPPIPPMPPIGGFSLMRRLYRHKGESQMSQLRRFISGKQLTKVDGGWTLALNNPLDADYEGLIDQGMPKGFRFDSSDSAEPVAHPLPDGLQVVSVFPPDGSIGGRKLGTAGSWEVAQKDNGFIKWTAEGKVYALPFLEA